MAWTRRNELVLHVGLGLLHALLFGLAFPPLGVWPLAAVSLAPLVSIALGTKTPIRSALVVGLTSLPMWGYHHQYIWKMSEAGVFPLVGYLALYPAVFVWALSWASKRLPRTPLFMLVPFLWVGLEYFRGQIMWHGYPWYLVSHPLIEMEAAAKYATIFGAYGVSAWVALITGWCFDAGRWMRVESKDEEHRARGRFLRLAGFTLAIGLLLGAASPSLPAGGREGSKARIAAVQTNVPQDNRASWSFEQRVADFERFAELSRQAAAADPPPELIVWPETMFPGNALNVTAVAAERAARLAYPGNIPTTVFYDALVELQSELGIPMVVGARAVEGLTFAAGAEGRVEETFERSHNSVFVVARGGVDERRYDKMHLTPFGEVMPYISAIPWLERSLLSIGARGMSFELAAGAAPTVLEAPRSGNPGGVLRLATPICFESTMPEVCRRLVASSGVRRADLLINLSNDGWFDWFDGGRENLLLQSRWRSLELGTPMVRAANTGLSAAIDAAGRVITIGPDDPEPPTGPERTAGVLVAEIPLPGERLTVFARAGDVIGLGCLIAGVVSMIGAGWRRTGSAPMETRKGPNSESPTGSP